MESAKRGLARRQATSRSENDVRNYLSPKCPARPKVTVRHKRSTMARSRRNTTLGSEQNAYCDQAAGVAASTAAAAVADGVAWIIVGQAGLPAASAASVAGAIRVRSGVRIREACAAAAAAASTDRIGVCAGI